MAYPSILSVLSNPQPTDRLNSPSHSGLHQNENTAITEIETFVGTLSSAVGTLVYDIRSSNSNGGGHIQTANTGGTGQTSFNKGDILVAQSSSVLTKLAVGVDNQVLLANSSVATGVSWAASPVNNVQSFLANGLWVKPTGISPGARVFVQVWGAGGGGGAASVSGNAGGGGGGGYTEAWYPASIISSSVLVGVSTGGVGSATTASIGGTSVFDTQSSLISAYGGGGGGGGGSSSGGGGGGGAYAVGGNGNGTSQGGGGAYGLSPLSSILATGGGAQGQPAQDALYAGGGGGGGGGVGGRAVFGGGGGGGSGSGGGGAGGQSMSGGNGQTGSIVGAGTVAPATTPGGGGGAGYGTGSTGGQGGGGKIIVTTFFG